MKDHTKESNDKGSPCTRECSKNSAKSYPIFQLNEKSRCVYYTRYIDSDHAVGETSLNLKPKKWTKEELVILFNRMIPNFVHKETGKYLDSKM